MSEDQAEQELTQAEQKKLEKQRKDEEYKAKEIKFGIRYKLVTLFSLIILGVAIGITIVATDQQTASLLEEKKKQGNIMVRALTASIRTRLLDIYAVNAGRLENMKGSDEYRSFYRNNGIAELIFEDVDQVINFAGRDEVTGRPDVIYAIILGKHRIVLGHSDPSVPPYSEVSFPAGTESYFTSYKKRNLEKIRPIITRINIVRKDSEDNEPVEAIDFANILSFKDDPGLADAIGEVHIGISLESVKREIFKTRVNLQLVGLLAILFGVVAAIVFATLIARPIQRVIGGMRLVSEGDFSANVLVKSKDEVGLLSRTFNVMLKGMSILVSPEVAQVVLSGGDLLKSGQRRDVTVLFSDIRSFTTISESLTPHEVVLMLNDYLEIMTDIIVKHGGVVDKFVGDEIFAVFGTPFEHPMHPLAACATAIDMGVELANHNDERSNEGKPPINIGIGVNTGPVIAGAMGSTKRVDFTSIGDAVNLGARLEGTNKVYGTLSIISEFTYEIVKEDVVVRELDLIKVKGKNKPVTIYELLDLTEQGQSKIDSYIEEKEQKKKGQKK